MAIVLITGAGSGLGHALACDYAAQGHQVYAGVRTLSNLPKSLSGPNIRRLKLDVTSNHDIDASLRDMVAEWGMPDILINNAGCNMPGTIEEFGADDWQAIFKVNCFAPLELSKKLLPHMRARGAGTIVMISSLSALVGLPYDGPYGASKAALESASESMAYELKPFGINVLVIQPGAIKTNLNTAPQIPAAPIADYSRLNTYMATRQRKTADGDDPATIARLIIEKIEDPGEALFIPVGRQATEISFLLKQGSAKDRDAIIRRASGLSWWFSEPTAKINHC